MARKQLKAYRLDPHAIQAIKDASKASGLSESEIVRGAIAKALKIPTTPDNRKRRARPTHKPTKTVTGPLNATVSPAQPGQEGGRDAADTPDHIALAIKRRKALAGR